MTTHNTTDSNEQQGEALRFIRVQDVLKAVSEFCDATQPFVGERFKKQLRNTIRAVPRAPLAAVEGDADSTLALCAVHRRIEDAGALECEVGNDCVACSLNERRELLQLIAPFAAEGNTEDSVTVMRRVAEFYATHVGDGRVIVSYPAAASSPLPAEPPCPFEPGSENYWPATPPETPVVAREAARNAAREWLRSERAAFYATVKIQPPPVLMPQIQKREDEAVEQLAAIITRYLGATPVAADWFDLALRYMRGDPTLTDVPYSEDSVFAEFLHFWDAQTPHFRSVVGSIFKAAPKFTTTPPSETAVGGEAKIDFSCRVCGVQCSSAPDPPARAVCPEHCEDHDYRYERNERGHYCRHCGQQAPEDWYDD